MPQGSGGLLSKLEWRRRRLRRRRGREQGRGNRRPRSLLGEPTPLSAAWLVRFLARCSSYLRFSQNDIRVLKLAAQATEPTPVLFFDVPKNICQLEVRPSACLLDG